MRADHIAWVRDGAKHTVKLNLNTGKRSQSRVIQAVPLESEQCETFFGTQD